MSYAGDDAPLTVSVGRYPLGHPEQAVWVQAQISDSAECYVSTIFTGTTLYTGGQVCLAAGESILLMDPVSGEVRQLDLSPMSAPLPDGVSARRTAIWGPASSAAMATSFWWARPCIRRVYGTGTIM